jgi:hypothetical protein
VIRSPTGATRWGFRHRVTVVVADAWLLAVFGSGVSLVTLTTLLTTPLLGRAVTFTTSDEATLVFWAMEAAVHVMVPLFPLAGVAHDQPAGAVTLSNVVPTGS